VAEEQAEKVTTAELVTIPEEKIRQFETDVSLYVRQSKEFQVTCTDDLEIATDRIRAVKERRAELKKVFKPLYDAQKLVASMTKERWDYFDEPLEECERLYKEKGVAFTRAEEKRLDEERRRLEEEERKQQEEQRLNAALMLDAAEHHEEADALLDAPLPPPVMPPKMAPPKVSGFTAVKKYDGEVYDFRSLVQAVALGKAPLSFLMPDTVAIRQAATSMKDGFSYPGIRLVRKDHGAVR
jgi:hypothetical protein